MYKPPPEEKEFFFGINQPQLGMIPFLKQGLMLFLLFTIEGRCHRRPLIGSHSNVWNSDQEVAPGGIYSLAAAAMAFYEENTIWFVGSTDSDYAKRTTGGRTLL